MNKIYLCMIKKRINLTSKKKKHLCSNPIHFCTKLIFLRKIIMGKKSELKHAFLRWNKIVQF